MGDGWRCGRQRVGGWRGGEGKSGSRWRHTSGGGKLCSGRRLRWLCKVKRGHFLIVI